MQVEIWSDFACPFCYIGKRRFEKALEKFPNRGDIQVIYRSFELDPHAPKHVPYDVYDMLARKFGMSREQAIAMNQPLFQQAAAEGLAFQYEGLVLANTFDAHRLRHFADKRGKGAEVSERLFSAYFCETKDLGDPDTLADIAAQAGLDREEALSVLASGQFADRVREEEEEGRSLGIRGVPFYVIDRKYAVSGAQAESAFLEALRQAWDERQPLQMLETPSGSACIDGSCAIDEPAKSFFASPDIP